MTKISDLLSGSPASALLGSEGFHVDQGGTSKGATGTQIKTMVNKNFNTRAALVTWAATSPAVGTIATGGGYSYLYIGSGTAISDLAGWIPFGIAYPDHWAANLTPGTTDMGSAIQSALNYSKSIFLANTSYATSIEIQGDQVRIFGANNGGQASKLIGLSASLAVGSSILSIRNCSVISDILFSYDTLTGTEAKWERVALRTNYGGITLNRGASCERLRFDNVGTAVSDFGAGEFSVLYHTMDIRRHTYAGIYMSSGARTGSVWANIYINHNADTTLNPFYGFYQEGADGLDITVLNVEHSNYKVAAVKFKDCFGVRIGTMHLEGVDLTVASHGYIEIDGGDVSITHCQVQQTRMTHDNTSIFRLYAAGFSVGSTIPTEFRVNSFLCIDTLSLEGIAYPSATQWPTYTTDYPARLGVANCAGYVVFRRDSASTDTNFFVEVGYIEGGPYNVSGTADRDYYKSPDYSADGYLVFNRFGARGALVLTENLLKNGYFDSWISAGSTLTSGSQEYAESWFGAGSSGTMVVTQVANELGAEGSYNINLNVTVAGTFQSFYQDIYFADQFIEQDLELTFEMMATAPGAVFNQITASLTNTGGTPSSFFQQIASSANKEIQAHTSWFRHSFKFRCSTGANVTVLGTAPSIRLAFQINDNSGIKTSNVSLRNISLRKVDKLGPPRRPFDRLIGALRVDDSVAPAIAGRNNPTSGIGITTNEVDVYTGGTSRLAVKSTDVTATVPILAPNGSAGAPSIGLSGSSTTGLFRHGADVIGITFGGTEDASWLATRLRLGSPSNNVLGTGGVRLEIVGDTFGKAAVVQAAMIAATTGPNFIFGKSRGVSVTDYAIVSTSDVLGTISFRGADGTTLINNSATISAIVEGTPASGDVRAGIRFYTGSGAAVSTEAVRIDISQNVGIGAVTPTCRLDVNGAIRTRAFTVGTLPAAATAGGGAMAYVTDSNTIVYNATVAAGGSNKIQVISDGTNWKVS